MCERSRSYNSRLCGCDACCMSKVPLPGLNTNAPAFCSCGLPGLPSTPLGSPDKLWLPEYAAPRSPWMKRFFRCARAI